MQMKKTNKRYMVSYMQNLQRKNETLKRDLSKLNIRCEVDEAIVVYWMNKSTLLKMPVQSENATQKIESV